MQIIMPRRDFLASASWAAAAGLLGARPALADEGPPETTTIRLRVEDTPPNVVNGVAENSVCNAPAYIAEDLLRAEGFTDIAGGCASRLLRAVRAGGDPHRHRSERQTGSWPPMSGSTPRRTSTGSRRMTSQIRWSYSSRAGSMPTSLTCRNFPYCAPRKIGRVIVDMAIPKKIIAAGSDWRFLNELKRELKA